LIWVEIVDDLYAALYFIEQARIWHNYYNSL